MNLKLIIFCISFITLNEMISVYIYISYILYSIIIDYKYLVIIRYF